jgi:hypothetical protein
MVILSSLIMVKGIRSVLDTLPVAQLYKNVMYIENTCILAILQMRK